MALPLAAGLLSFFISWQVTKRDTSAIEKSPKLRVPIRRQGSHVLGSARSAGSLYQWQEQVEGSSVTELSDLARQLISSSHRNDLAMWQTLLAAWSEQDGQGMIDFIEKDVPISQRETLLEIGWFAWGAAEPDAAFVLGKTLSGPREQQFLMGVAAVDARKAAEFLSQMPNSQMSRYYISRQIVQGAPDLVDGMLQSAIYDGGRVGFQSEWVKQLAATDPAKAVEYADNMGIIFQDNIRIAIDEIAKKDPAAALEQIQMMPSNRSKALSSVTLAKDWVRVDRDKALSWIRGSLTGPVQHYALVEAAEATGTTDPEGALGLVLEAGLEPVADFYDVRGSSIMMSESSALPDAGKTAAYLFQRLAQTDPEGAERYLQDHIPSELQEKFRSYLQP
ncbi:hypothetical protein JIN85_16625 [Luteolibacter pohnpeiensis]|uniref:Uncharacterized protein n=1 Tax=Luteolibacter pohnpeiensis TaxID=454153 RepID=A0A934VS93_9BACT|nr:hypothetical protein [Luteolibacter pohnpeiensis]MBK1884046.1 hypothetical protein [Luteolibacter pohnpeiensis]